MCVCVSINVCVLTSTPGAHVPRARDGEGEHVLRGVQAARVPPVQAGRLARQPQSHHHEQRLQDPQGTALTHTHTHSGETGRLPVGASDSPELVFLVVCDG